MTANNRFKKLNVLIKPMLINLIPSILPNGKRRAGYWVSLNPTRNDRNIGSFRINLNTGQWIDFATDDSGGDVISLFAYLYGYKQGEAADYIAKVTGVAVNDN